ncbi:uncharacterized protein LOC131239272 [Magnolia sinica]|uniref:uncharacterized protein LOC131239272 n=1 Tax=Magnolia sinica TaxID=86752 RepID=UPI00265A215B|nr:uncharacterized protein LOC131239272 [Magnolia sinica]
MKYSSQWWILSSAILLLTISVHASRTLLRKENEVKTAVFLSPAFVLGSGSVSNKVYLNVDFPRGHIALKDFNGEVIDEAGNPIPLYETYLHHWVLARYYSNSSAVDTNITFARNAGVCQGNVLGQYYGLGSETRRTSTHVPDPYGVEVGNPAEIPNGYVERWLLNVHAIDTRGVVDRMGCAECRCNLYNVTKDESGSPLRKDYIGGLDCCYDQTQCRLRESFENVKRKLYLRYTVKWVDWHDSIVPVKIYIFDVTDSGKRTNSTSENARLGCKIEYDVEPCGAADMGKGHCVDSKKMSIVMPRGGDVIYGVAHQHWGGVGSTLHGQDGRVICSSIPIYGNGKEAGNEDGYIVGMSTCYPKPGSVKISDGEVLTLKSNYSSSQIHTGVMGLFYILVADLPLKN